MTLVLNDAEVRQALGPAQLVDAIELAFKGDDASTVVPDRLNIAADGRFLRVMPAMIPALGRMGYKVFHGGGDAGVRYLVSLLDLYSGEVLALLDACYLTAARTAATSALAARAMGRSSTRVGLIGAGHEAEAHAMAIAACDDVEVVKIFSPREESRTRLAAKLRSQLDAEVTVCATPQEACRGVTHLVTATNTGPSGAIACQPEWLEPGTHLSAIGSTTPGLRELNPAIFRMADRIVFDVEAEQIAGESGDVIAYLAEGGDLAGVVTLGSLIRGDTGEVCADDGITVFKSVGSALQDMVAADLAYRNALAAGLGTRIADVAHPKPRL